MLLISLSQSVFAQNAEYAYDYLSAHPELLDRLPTPEQVNAEARGEREEERDAWRAATFERLITGVRDMLGPRQFHDRDTWRPAERAAIERYEQAYSDIASKYEYGYWYGKKQEYGVWQQRAIHERYLPEYIGWSKAQGRPLLPISDITTFAEDEAQSRRDLILGSSFISLIIATLILIYVAVHRKTERGRNLTWLSLGGIWGLAIIIAVIVGIVPFATIFLMAGQIALVALIVGIVWRFRPPDDQKLRTKRADHFLRACTGMNKETFGAATREERRTAIKAEVHKQNASIKLTADFRFKQRFVGMIDAPLQVALRNFTIERARVSMAENWHFLAGAALLYNEGKISPRIFEIQALSLVYEDGVGQLATWGGWQRGQNLQEIRSVHDALRWIMTRRYRTAQAVKEDLRVRLYKLFEEQATSNDEDDDAIRTAGSLAGVG